MLKEESWLAEPVLAVLKHLEEIGLGSESYFDLQE